jgi:uncharacterized protein
MHINIEDLEASENKSISFHHNYGANSLTLEDEDSTFRQGPEVTGTARVNGSQVEVKGSVSAIVETPCDRCLKSVDIAVNSDFDVTYVSTIDYQRSETRELLAEDLEFSFHDGEKIDIDELTREQVILSLPARILCKEECSGLCTVCGQDLNAEQCQCRENEIDPRWQALRDLKYSNKKI